MGLPGIVSGTTTATAAGTSDRYQILVSGQNFSNRVNVERGPVRLLLSGPGGVSSAQFTVERPVGGGIRPFLGRAPVFIYDTLSDLKFRGFIVHIVSYRTQGTNLVTTVDCAGYDKLLDERIVRFWKTRPDTAQRNRKFDHDDEIIKFILHGPTKLDYLATGGFITRTNSNMDDMTFTNVTVREALQQVADVAQIASSTSTRRFYVGASDGVLHYYSGQEGLPAPFFINEDDRYVRTMRTASGIAAFWSGRLNDSGNVYDHVGPAGINAPLNGGVFNAPSLCAGHRELPAMRFNGSTGYLSPNDATLHPGNTGSWGMVFRRGSTGSQQALWSGGTDDILIGFDANDHIRVQKEGTGDGFVSNATYTSTTYAYHLVVTHSAGNGFKVYVNGDAIAGTASARTLSAGSNTVNIGRKKTTADQYFQGRMWGVWASSSEFSAATVLAQFRVWLSVEPEGLVVDRDSADTTQQVWVKGGQDDKQKGNGTGTGWVVWHGSSDAAFEGVVGPGDGGPVLAQEFIDRPDSDNTNKRNKYGNSYLSSKAGTVVSATFSLTYDPQYIQLSDRASTWRPGMVAYITSADAHGLTLYPLEIKQVDVNLNRAAGMTTYEISAGALPYSGLRRIRAIQSRGMA